MNDKPKTPDEAQAGQTLAAAPGSAIYNDGHGHDHDEVRCESMADWDCDNLCPGTPRTCCVCSGHDCEEARDERLKHPTRISPNAEHTDR